MDFLPRCTDGIHYEAAMADSYKSLVLSPEAEDFRREQRRDKTPELAHKIEASHHSERLKQANQMMTVRAGRAEPERLAASMAVASEVDP